MMEIKSFLTALFRSYETLQTHFFDTLNLSTDEFRKEYDEHCKTMSNEDAFRKSLLEWAEKKLEVKKEKIND
jgi:hypothetical protein